MNPEVLLTSLSEGRRLVAALLDAGVPDELSGDANSYQAAEVTQKLVSYLVEQLKCLSAGETANVKQIDGELKLLLKSLGSVLGPALEAYQETLQAAFLTRLSYLYASLLSLKSKHIIECADALRADVNLNARFCLVEQDIRELSAGAAIAY
ncbi:MAG: hypothetical protein K1X79_00995 [Oligoflexia bacterium]|nr:hypothetical protein [Oligoflexia bacterium]